MKECTDMSGKAFDTAACLYILVIYAKKHSSGGGDRVENAIFL